MTDTQENFDNLTNALLEVCEEAEVEGMNAPFVGVVEIQFFSDMLRECAPTPGQGESMALDAVTDTFTGQTETGDSIALDLSSALDLTRAPNGEGLTLSAEETKTLYSSIWRVEAALTDTGIIKRENTE